METWHVYQLRSDAELLYVGYTRRLRRRLGEHRRGKPWWPEVTRTQSERFGSEDQARQREKEIWATGSPKYNRRSPFATEEERIAAMRARVAAWQRTHQEQRREYLRAYGADPEKRPAIRANSREWQKRNRPTTVEGRRIGSRAGRQKQSGPSLFD